jgi:hypothetical protein
MADRPSDAPKLGRNDPCGAWQKYKKCHGAGTTLRARSSRKSRRRGDARRRQAAPEDSEAAARHGDFKSRTRVVEGAAAQRVQPP